ncbi:unnamed protein product [Rhizoctonia solani]|uniref:F-box domain-containing protein n=1 Tax=Rhizoctonia solani TaxID=456999 RepID=A0A8H3I1X3_9AGAM|nr:unnamed protein product [Rhizoctonia solani]
MKPADLGFGSRVPPEVVSHVLSWLHDSYDISDASRVCRAWYKLAFPHLHQHMNINRIRYLHTLTVRLELETAEKEFKVGPFLRALTIKLVPDVLGDSWHRPLLIRFERVLSRLIHLELLDVVYASSPSLMSIFQSFQNQCPKLRWVIIGRSGGGPQDDRNEEVFIFKDLKRLQISWRHLDLQSPSHVPSSLTKMIEGSPMLDELRLNLIALEMDDDHIDTPWWPSAFFSCLANPLVYLRTLQIGGEYDIDWGIFLEESSQCALRRFFEQHPDLHTVAFQWSDERRMDLAFKPHLAESLFPSVQQFGGPLAICAGVAGSRLAEQLRELNVHYDPSDSIQPDNNTFETLAQAMRLMPKLEGLSLTISNTEATDNHPEKVFLETATLDKMLAAMPNVWSILIGAPIDWTQMVQPLRHVPHLTEFHFKDSRRSKLEDAILFKRIAVEMFNVCPMLRQIISLREKDEGGFLNLYRTVDRFGDTTEISLCPF